MDLFETNPQLIKLRSLQKNNNPKSAGLYKVH